MALPLPQARGLEREPHASAAVARCSEARTRELMRGDLAAWQAIWGRPAKWLLGRHPLLGICYMLCVHAGLRATLIFRLSHGLQRHGVPALPTMLQQFNLALHGLDIPPHCRIGPGLYIPHPVGTVVTCASIGARCSLISCVTIGMRGEHAFPTLGDDVFVGAGARILGPIRVGDRAQVGANAVVLHDVPDGISVVGVPARPLQTR